MTTKKKRKWTIAIRPDGETPRKITKIVGLNGRGFSILTPYHKQRSGFLFKHLVDLQVLGGRSVPWRECIGFTVEDRAKLSYHMDGFAQFSSETPGKIISGRDEKTGEPKGLGLLARALTNPSISGPSVGVTVWGLDDFEQAESDGDLITFDSTEWYYRRSTPETANLWHLAIYAFAPDNVPPLRFKGKDSVMTYTPHPITAGVAGAGVEMKTVFLEAERI